LIVHLTRTATLSQGEKMDGSEERGEGKEGESNRYTSKTRRILSSLLVRRHVPSGDLNSLKVVIKALFIFVLQKGLYQSE